VQAQGTGLAGPAASVIEVPRGSIFELIAAWLLLTEGGIGLIFLPVIVFSVRTDVAPARIAMFTLACLLCLGAGAALYSRYAWAWWAALAVAVGVAVWLFGTSGLTEPFQGYIAVGFGAVQVVLLLLGRRAAGRPEAMALTSAGISFNLKVALVWAAIFLVIGLILVLFQLDTPWIKENVSYIAKGLEYTILLALGAIILAVILALLGALGRLSKNPVAFGLSGFYTSFFRGTPLIVQLFVIYLALPQIGGNLERISLVNILTLTTFQAGVLGLGLNYGAYMTEIFRAGIQSVSHGQAEAADALGMSYPQRMRRVVLPQATRVIIPPTGNEFIAMMKDTALVGLLGVELSKAEIFRRAQLVGNQDYRKLEALLIAAAMYWALTAVFTFFQRKLERRVSKGYERGAATTMKPDQKTKLISASAAGGPGGGAMMVEIPEQSQPGVLPPTEEDPP
jgi:polar amino acid transport system permease protein